VIRAEPGDNFAGFQIREQAMAKIEPGSASDGMFDDIDDGAGDEEGSRLPLLIVIALLVLAAFGGVVWLAYNQGLQKGRLDAPRPLLAEQTQPGSHNGIKVYEQPATPDADTGEEDSAPPPPTTTAKVTPQATAPEAAPPPVVATPKPTVTAPPPPSTMTAQTATKPPQQLATPKPDVVAAPKIKPIPPIDTPVATPPAAASSGDYVLQIGSYKSQDDANAAWKSYRAKHAMMAVYEPDVLKVDLADKGTWYRLRAGAFASKDAAAAFCAKLKADGGDCLLAKK
jgi:cell division septation protein DedD